MAESDHILRLLQQGEGLTLEFKEARTELPKSLFETICAFLNREGGTLLLGVRDDGTVTGVEPAEVTKLTKEIIPQANNPEKLAPICRLFPEPVDVGGKSVLVVPVPLSSQVHRTKNAIFDRGGDGDFRVTDQEATRLLYDRDYVQCALIEAYDRLMACVRKHVADPFFLQGTQGVSLRDQIFREVVVNFLARRKYGSGYPARLIVYADHVLTENASRTYHSGPLDPERFTPYPKNPAIANVFREIGFMDRLGSGLRRVTQYQPAFTPGRRAEFVEGDLFRVTIPIPVLRNFDAEREFLQDPGKARGGLTGNVKTGADAERDPVNDATNCDDAVNDAVKERLKRELKLLIREKGSTLPRIKEEFGIQRATAQRDMALLRQVGLVVFEGAPKSGRYVLTEEGNRKLNRF